MLESLLIHYAEPVAGAYSIYRYIKYTAIYHISTRAYCTVFIHGCFMLLYLVPLRHDLKIPPEGPGCCSPRQVETAAASPKHSWERQRHFHLKCGSKCLGTSSSAQFTPPTPRVCTSVLPFYTSKSPQQHRAISHLSALFQFQCIHHQKSSIWRCFSFRASASVSKIHSYYYVSQAESRVTIWIISLANQPVSRLAVITLLDTAGPNVLHDARVSDSMWPRHPRHSFIFPHSSSAATMASVWLTGPLRPMRSWGGDKQGWINMNVRINRLAEYSRYYDSASGIVQSF